jgi:nucleoside-diphosphate-sugar epimerase
MAIGSGWEYGVQQGKLSENTTSVPFDAYTAAKHSLNWLGWEIAKENGMDFVWMRLFFVYGPGQRLLALIPSLLASIKAGKKPEIRNPNAKNDFVYVEDVAEAIALAVKKCFPRKGADPKHCVYNVGSGKLTGVIDIVKYICLKYNLKINYKKTAKQPQDKITTSYADITKIRKEIGWRPKTSIQEGITLTIKDFI